MYCVRWSNEAATVHADITADHRDVPAILFEWHEAKPRTSKTWYLSCCSHARSAVISSLRSRSCAFGLTSSYRPPGSDGSYWYS